MNPADWIVWRLVRNVKPGDRIVVGVGTPLALCAAVIGRELHYDVQLVVGGAYQPHLADIASAVNRPEQLPGLSHGVLGQEMLLEHVQRGAFSLQFVSPAQVDARGRLNTVAVAGRRWLAGPLAIPDVSVGVQRLIGYRAEHSRRVLVDRVDHVTGAGTDTPERSRFRLAGAGMAGFVTSQAELTWNGDGFTVSAVRDGVTVEEVIAGCRFDMPVDLDGSEPPDDLAELLNRFDPTGVRELETEGVV